MLPVRMGWPGVPLRIHLSQAGGEVPFGGWRGSAVRGLAGKCRSAWVSSVPSLPWFRGQRLAQGDLAIARQLIIIQISGPCI